jgi:hypothetical protein
MPMRRVLVLLAFVLPPSVLAQVPASVTPDPEEIVERYIAARGGLENIRSVRTLILRGPPRPDGRPGRFMARARPFYYLVGEPSPTRDFAEGFDGSAWEFYGDPGLVLRTTDAPAAAARHTGYFDDPLVSSLEPGWKIERLGTEEIGGRPAHWLRATYPDGFQTDVFVDTETGLISAYRKAAPIHAFGEAVETETRVSDYRELNGALFPMRFDEYVIATEEPLHDLGGGWATAEVNAPLPLDYFSPPSEPGTPLARMLNAAYMTRSMPQEALAWYRDFRANPATAGIDTEAGMEALGYQCLKNGAVETGVLLLEANLADYPDSAAAHFGLGRAYRAAGREAEAVVHFHAALAIDPTHRRAAEELARPSAEMGN